MGGIFDLGAMLLLPISAFTGSNLFSTSVNTVVATVFTVMVVESQYFSWLVWRCVNITLFVATVV